MLGGSETAGDTRLELGMRSDNKWCAVSCYYNGRRDRNKDKSAFLLFNSYREELDDISVAGDADQAALKRRGCA